MTQRLDASRLEADLVLVGAGAAATHTLLSLLDELSTPTGRSTKRPRVVIVDRNPEFFTGVAYGARSGRTSLTLSTLEGFLPTDERVRFVEWVTGHLDHVLAIEPAWLERMPVDASTEQWNELFIPRGLYGAYLADRARCAIVAAEAEGTAEFEFVTANVTAIESSNDGYVVFASSSGGALTMIGSSAVVLAIGSPPVRRLPPDDDTIGDCIHDVYDPGLDHTVERLLRTLAELPPLDRRILVVGGNATALEFVLASQGMLRNRQVRITVLSPAGRPRHWRRVNNSSHAEICAITTLAVKVRNGADVTAAELFEAVKCDLQAADRSGTEVATIGMIAQSIPHFTDSFREGERVALAARHGMQISNLLRQDCRDSFDVLEPLVEAGAVDFEAGRFLRCQPEGGYLRVIVTNDARQQRHLDTRYAAIVGAVGFETMSATRSPLLRKMLASGLVEPSSSDSGLRVDGRYQAADRLFVVGPLLAGNVQPDMVIWHAESVRRIMVIARSAAKCIADELTVGSRSS